MAKQSEISGDTLRATLRLLGYHWTTLSTGLLSSPCAENEPELLQMWIENATTLQAHFLPLIRRLRSNQRKNANALNDADK